MKKLKPAGGVVMVLVLVAAFAALVFAGDLDPPAGPNNPGSAMYTLEDAYNRLDTGAAGVKRAGGFTEPSTGPGSTGRTLDEVMDKMPAADDTDGAAPEDVAAGKIYWGLRTDGSWGQQTGTSATCATCSGTLSTSGRWCDQEDGTIKDMTTSLVWLKDASWGGGYPFWENSADSTNAHDRAALVKNGTPVSLTDGSVEGDWRLPTKEELYGLANGTEAVRLDNQQSFTGIQTSYYWSSTTYASDTLYAWSVGMSNGVLYGFYKQYIGNVWPVRSDN